MELFSEIIEFIVGLKEMGQNSEEIIKAIGEQFKDEFANSNNQIGVIRRPEGLTLAFFDERFEMRVDANIYVPDIQTD